MFLAIYNPDQCIHSFLPPIKDSDIPQTKR